MGTSLADAPIPLGPSFPGLDRGVCGLLGALSSMI